MWTANICCMLNYLFYTILYHREMHGRDETKKNALAVFIYKYLLKAALDKIGQRR